MQKLKIAILSYRSAPFGGGQGIYIRDISRALSIMGHRIDVISGPPYPNLVDEINLIKLPGLDLFQTFSFKERLRIFYNIKNKKLVDFYEFISVLFGGFPEMRTFGYRANKFLKLSQTIKDSLFTSKKYIQIEELKTIYETEKKETEILLQKQEIESLNKGVEISNLRKGLYAGGMFTFIAVSILLYFGFKQRIKKNQIEREKQEAIYKQEIAFKKKELASQTLHLVQKNTFIQELKENLVKIKQSPELFKVEFRRLVMLLKKESAEDKDWEVFKSYFSEVHNNFDKKLKGIYADISEKEIRLASFIRMNLSTKEIASMLNVMPDSVSKSKYRLKKKLNLPKEADLNTFLYNL